MRRACERIWPRLVDGTATEAERLHASECADCRAAEEAFGVLGAVVPRRKEDESVPGPAPVSAEGLPEALRVELSRSGRWTWKLGALLLALLGAGFVAFGLWKLWNGGVPGVPRDFGIPLAVLFAGVVGVGAVASLRPGTRGLLRAVPIAACGLFVLVILCASGRGPAGPFWSGLACAKLELMVAVAPLVVGLLALRNTAFDVGRALTLGASCAGVGLVALTLFCPQGHVAHQLTFHVVPGLLLMLVAVVVRRLLPTRSHAP